MRNLRAAPPTTPDRNLSPQDAQNASGASSSERSVGSADRQCSTDRRTRGTGSTIGIVWQVPRGRPVRVSSGLERVGHPLVEQGYIYWSTESLIDIRRVVTRRIVSTVPSTSIVLPSGCSDRGPRHFRLVPQTPSYRQTVPYRHAPAHCSSPWILPWLRWCQADQCTRVGTGLCRTTPCR